METVQEIKQRVQAAVPGATLEVIANGAVADQASLLVDAEHALAVARFLRDDAALRLDDASNVTGVDWLDRLIEERHRVRKTVDGVEREFEEVRKVSEPGYLEVVYHLYSMALRHGPVILRVRTRNRTDQVRLPSLTPVWRGCELQEREVYDLFGVVFEGHPDLRRLLMWDEFKEHPMRKDYVSPDDFEYEPTPHDAVLSRAREHYPQATSP